MARATLANERVSMSSGSTFGIGVESLLRLAERGRRGRSGGQRRLTARRGLLVEAQSIGLLAHRSTLRTLAGADPAGDASVRKLLGAEHEQRVQERGWTCSAPTAPPSTATAHDGGRTGSWSPVA